MKKVIAFTLLCSIGVLSANPKPKTVFERIKRTASKSKDSAKKHFLKHKWKYAAGLASAAALALFLLRNRGPRPGGPDGGGAVAAVAHGDPTGEGVIAEEETTGGDSVGYALYQKAVEGRLSSGEERSAGWLLWNMNEYINWLFHKAGRPDWKTYSPVYTVEQIDRLKVEDAVQELIHSRAGYARRGYTIEQIQGMGMQQRADVLEPILEHLHRKIKNIRDNRGSIVRAADWGDQEPENAIAASRRKRAARRAAAAAAAAGV